MEVELDSEHQKSPDSVPSGSQAPCCVDLKITHLDWTAEATLIHFQGQYLTICELDYIILHREIQNRPKVKAAVSIGDFCLVEDLTSGLWYRGRVQNQKNNLFDVFLIDHGNILSVDITYIPSCSNDLFILPPKIVCGFLSGVQLFQGSCQFDVDRYFSSLIGRNVTGYIQAHLPYKALLLEAPDINSDLVRHGFGRHVDTDTFLFLVETLTEVALTQSTEQVPTLHVEKSRGQAFCFKLSNLQGYVDILSVSGPRLSCGTCAKVRVSAAVDSGLFFCQMVNMEAVLKEMSKKLAVLCEHKIKDGKHMTESIDQLCSVKSKDENWYRCFVPYLPVNSQIRVLFIDYGYFETVGVENVCSLPPDIWSVPIMAFPCALSCQDETVKLKQISFLKAGLLGGVLDVEINRFDKEHHCYSITVHGVEHNPVMLPDPVQHLTQMDSVDSDSMTKKNSLLGGCLSYDTIMSEAMNKIREEIEVDSVFVGYVEHVHSPTEFWIRSQKRNEEFEELMMKMTSYYSKEDLFEDVLEDPEPGTMCSAMYEADMHFYRAVVTDTLEHGAEVFFIDFGNIEKVPKMLIKNIPERFASKTAFALRSTLANVAPLDEVWTSNNCDFFRRAVSNKALLVRVVQIRKDKFVVNLHELEHDSDSITEFLISSRQALYAKAIPSEAVQNVKQKKTQFLRHHTLSNISRKTEQQEDCKKEPTCKKEPEKPKASAGFRALSIKPGYEFAVCCSHINSLHDFWCQPLNKAPALKALMTEIQAYYSTFTVALQPGDLSCVVKSPQDGRWYRAFITETQQSHVKVILVDYGFTIQVEYNRVQSILPEYMYLEGQAFKCSLNSLIEPVDPTNKGDWSPDACSFLENFINNSTSSVRCKVVLQLNVKSKLCNVVDLFNTQTQQNITDMLVDQNLARKVTISPQQLPAVFPESFVFSSCGLSPGNEEQVYVTHVNSQWEVYCQLEKNTKIIEELECKITEENKKMTETSTRAVVKRLCLAKYLDGKWYRGLAHPVPSPLYLCVYFVDYGNMIIAEKANVTFIPRDSTYLLYTPMQGFRFTLASVSKEVLYANVKEWLDEAVLNKQMKAVIVGKSDDGSFDVELFDGEVNINKKVQELILSLSPQPKTVVSFDERSSKPNKYAHRGTHLMKARQKRQAYTMNVPVKAQNKNIQAKQHKQTKKETQKTMTKFQIKPKRSQNSAKNEPQQTEETNIPQISHLPASKVRAGFRAKCFISHMDSISSFSLQLLEDEADIIKMDDDLNSCVFRDSLQTCASLKLKINDLVLAESKEDGALYRAVVTDYEGSSSLKVEFIDYGNSAIIGKEKIFAIPKDYISQHRFSITCSLLNASACESNASFSDTVLDDLVVVDFVHQSGSHWEVKIEILDGAVSVKHETFVENASVLETEEELVTSQILEEVRSCEESYPEIREEEVTECERSSPTVKGESKTLASQVCVTLSAENKSVSTKNQRESLKLTVKGKNDDSAVIPPVIKVKNTESGKVLSVQSNGDFYIRLNEGSDKLVILEKHIADSLEKCITLPEEDVKEGLKCLVHVDNQWQRAVVQHVDQKKCQVLLVDHGITKGVPRDSIAQQWNSLINIPAFAVLCRLKSFTELLEFSEEAENDQKLCYETLKTMIGKEVKLVFLHCSGTDHPWLVEIVMNGPSLIRQISASLQKKEAMITQSPAETQTEDSSLPQQFELAPVHINREYSGFVAAVTSPFEFYVVLEDSHFILNIVSNMLNEIPELTLPLPEAHIIPGTSCMLKSDSKSKWCRAEIMHSDTTVVLNLVDYGHYECLPYEERSKLKRLPEKIRKLPKFTYPCILRGVKPSGGGSQWNDEAAFFFKQCMYQKNIKIFFRELVSNIQWKVDVLADGVHVTKKLVDAGHASFVDIILGLRFQEWRPCERCPHIPEGEEGCDEEEIDEDSERRSDHTGASDEVEGTMALNVALGSPKCKREEFRYKHQVS